MSSSRGGEEKRGRALDGTPCPSLAGLCSFLLGLVSVTLTGAQLHDLRVCEIGNLGENQQIARVEGRRGLPLVLIVAETTLERNAIEHALFVLVPPDRSGHGEDVNAGSGGGFLVGHGVFSFSS